jgi:hypothetical protein
VERRRVQAILKKKPRVVLTSILTEECDSIANGMSVLIF